jgi:Protein of unknown function (DUF2384)
VLVLPPARPRSYTQQVLLSYSFIMASPLKVPRRQRTTRSWQPVAGKIVFRPAAGTLVDVRPLLARIISALGTNAAGRLLDADRGQISRWVRNREPVSAEMGRRIVDLHDILTRVLRIYSPEAASSWLVGSEPLLGGARPIDVLALEGAAPVIRAIDGISQGAYA